MLEVKNWICFNKYVHSAGCPVEFCMGKNILERNEKKVIQGKSIQMGDFTHRYCRYRIVTTTL